MELTNIYCPYCNTKSQDIVTSQEDYLLGVECCECGSFFDIKIGETNETYESDSVICSVCGIRERRIFTKLIKGKRFCRDCCPKDTSQKEIKCIGLTVDTKDIDEDSMKEAVDRAFSGVVADHSFVNLIKVQLGDVRADQANALLKNIHQLFVNAGADNVVLVPINECIKDITVEKIEVEHK